MKWLSIVVVFCSAFFAEAVSAVQTAGECASDKVQCVRGRSFEIGEKDFLLDGKPFVIHCGEVHYARIPRPYWRHRLKMLRAMGLNAVGCYMFWNFHEREPGKFNWEGAADAAAFCRMAQEEGLWVILRPGPYACAEWEGGGAPWWLMANDTANGAKPISMRSSDPRWLVPATNWIHAVGRQLAPLQATRGGPILLVQIENEYGIHGSDKNYMRALRSAALEAGFEMPLYACNPPRVVKNGFIPELFQAANFGAYPEQLFALVKEVQPKGPHMCAEYYPAWFDTWGQAHHPPKNDRAFFGPIDWMLARGVSFSLYMAHGGTSFGGWSGCRHPFIPNVTSYDYEAPISEQGRANPSFAKMAERIGKHLNAGETVGKMPEPIPVKAYGKVALTRRASLDVLVACEVELESPVYMERLGQGFGLVAYERWIDADDHGALYAENVHDFGYVFVDSDFVGVLDRRHRSIKPVVPRGAPGARRRLRLLLEPMGRINSSQGMEDRKGVNGRVRIGNRELAGGWTAKMMPIDPDGFSDPLSISLLSHSSHLSCLSPSSHPSHSSHLSHPSLYCGLLSIPDSSPVDTFLDMSGWTKGIAWVNGHNLGRFWCVGPQQTLYVPGCWMKKGDNEIVILDFFGPRGEYRVDFRDTPLLDVLRPELDFNRKERMNTKFIGGAEVASGSFPSSGEPQVVMFDKPASGNFFTFWIGSVYDKKNLAAVAEVDFLDAKGNPLTALDLSVSGVDSEEEIREDGAAENAIDGQVEAPWVTSSRTLPHWIEFSSGTKVAISGFRYTPRQSGSMGRIKDWKFYVR